VCIHIKDSFNVIKVLGVGIVCSNRCIRVVLINQKEDLFEMHEFILLSQ